MKKSLFLLLSLLWLPCLFLACGSDDEENDGDDSISIEIKDDGKTSNGWRFVSIDEHTFYLDYVKYTVSEGHLVVSGYDKAGFSGVARIPSSIKYKGNDYEVLGIGGGAFSECSNLVSIVIPNSVTYINDKAFYKTGLTAVTIPEKAKYIGHRCFMNCTSLASISIPNSLTAIGDYAFYGCTSLTYAIIPEKLEYLGDYVYYGCNSITDVFCYPIEPLGGNEFFSTNTIQRSTLHVPSESVSTYKSTPGWRDFFSIVSLNMNGNFSGSR